MLGNVYKKFVTFFLALRFLNEKEENSIDKNYSYTAKKKIIRCRHLGTHSDVSAIQLEIIIYS